MIITQLDPQVIIDEQASLIAELTTENCRRRARESELEEKLDRFQTRINNYEDDRRYQQEVFANPHIEATHKLVLLAVRSEILTRKIDPTSYCHVDFGTIARKTGTTRFTVGRRTKQLVEFGAFGRFDEKVEGISKGKRIHKDHVHLCLNEIAISTPGDIKPLEEPTFGHGGTREHCKACGSENIKRVHHVRCMDCGHEHIATSELTQEESEMLDLAMSEPTQLYHDAIDLVQNAPHPEIAHQVDQAIEIVDQTREIAQEGQGQDAPQENHQINAVQDAPCNENEIEVVQDALHKEDKSNAVQDAPHPDSSWNRPCTGCGTIGKRVQSPTGEYVLHLLLRARA